VPLLASAGVLHTANEIVLAAEKTRAALG